MLNQMMPELYSTLSAVVELSMGPIYKISYANLLIILQQCQSYDGLTVDV